MPGNTGMLSPETPSRQGIQIGPLGGFEFREAARLERQAAQSVSDEQNDFGGIRFPQFADEVVVVHPAVLASRPRLATSQANNQKQPARGNHQGQATAAVKQAEKRAVRR